ncbi:DUF4129 domain-containing protein [Nocardia seriolae]|uniref:Protein-glutamine gamma-glutamyltransferase-like C-terminal domain-containing protein n=1 Tax=Nocardia seriolae TaxID=37332 RepID=A0A0B8N3N4_9NOCA|nr:DUF4129 domain-containing protein [Nocardia seriolae]APA94747.1 hypothetical protein NS506_00668 [Nocardia seriolae]MTJ60042.1 DUF4129 domain-containing protein [Nocardia seriolae]MTJ70112.1 DUF4129 domain-containing protein [Nocardia seriolae]MTJ85044.1 DUF4129 domain-containing protein [Nocardia seriolae]MTK29039.1 DUF4129 domain-containing protein [Nocardia seriolae]
MTETDHIPGPNSAGAVPPEPALGPAAAHLAAAEDAARRGDFGAALRERYRAVTRGLEQRGYLEEERARTARETARAATEAVPDAVELPSAAHSFDEVVYGGRYGTEAEYRHLEQADRFSIAPPPKAGPVEITEKRKARKAKAAKDKSRDRAELPEWLRDWRLWAAVAAIVVVGVLVFALTQLGPAPSVPNPPSDIPSPPSNPPSNPPERPDVPPPNFGAGSDSIFQQLPNWLAFGGFQFLIAWVAVLWWRGRRRGAIVREPLPVEAPANELLAGQAGLYRKSRDHEHVAEKLRSAALRRLRPGLGVTAETPAELVVAAVSARTGTDPAVIRATLYDPVADRDTLELVAAQLEWIEAEVL